MWFLKSSLNLETSSLNVNLQVFWDKMGFLTALGSIWYIIYDYSEQQYSRAGLHELWHPGFLVARKSRENGEIKGKWREIDSQYCLILSPFPSSFSISSFSLHFLPLFPFPPSLCHIFQQNMKNFDVGNGERGRKWRENEEMEWEIHSQDFLILCLFPPSLSISYIKNCHILSQNVKYGTFVANVTKNLSYALGKINFT